MTTLPLVEEGKLQELLSGIREILANPHTAAVLDGDTLGQLGEMEIFIKAWLQGTLALDQTEKLKTLLGYTAILAESTQRLNQWGTPGQTLH